MWKKCSPPNLAALGSNCSFCNPDTVLDDCPTNPSVIRTPAISLGSLACRKPLDATSVDAWAEDLCEYNNVDVVSRTLAWTVLPGPNLSGGVPVDDNWILDLVGNGVKAPAPALPPNISAGLGSSQTKRDLISLERFVMNNATWRVCDEVLYTYEPPCWHKLDDRQAVRKIRWVLMDYSELQDSLTSSEYREIYRCMLINPCLEYSEDFEPAFKSLNCNDGTIDLLTRQVHAHRAEDNFLSYVDVSCRDVLDPPEQGEIFEQFAYQVGNGDEAVRSQLLELTILALSGIELKHFFVLLGPSHTGKTQFGRFLEELVGRKNVESIRGIHDFGDRWTVGSLAGKKLATCLDLPDGILPASAVGIIKQFCGDDPIKGEVKYSNSFTFYRKPLLLLAGNHPIRLQNAYKEEAFLNRMVIIPFSNPVSENQMVHQLFEKLLAEKAYIINQAMEAFDLLASRNYAVTHAVVADEYCPQEGNLLRRSVCAFIETCVIEQQGSAVTTDALYQAYCSFVEESEAVPMSSLSFSRVFADLVARVAPQAQTVKRTPVRQLRGYQNLSLLGAYSIPGDG